MSPLKIFFLLLCIIILVFLIGFVFLCIKRKRKGVVYEELQDEQVIQDAILKNINSVVVYLDEKRKVLRTNYYNFFTKPKSLEDQADELLVGNMIRCKNAVASGRCGTHKYCSNCVLRQTIAETFSNKGEFKNLKAEMVLDKNGKKEGITILLSGKYVRIKGNDRVLLTLYDISEEEKKSLELLEAKMVAEKSVQEKNVFIAKTAHEIRTPINAIVGFSELLTQTTDSEEIASYSSIITQNKDLLQELIDNILDLSRIESGKTEFLKEEVDINTFLKEIGLMSKVKIAEKPIEVELQFDEKGSVVNLDKTKLMQVMMNFVNNAYKFMEKGTLFIGGRFLSDTEQVYLYVKDQGPGIPKEKCDSIFHQFTRLDQAVQGTGLGLAISKSLITKMDGQIGVTSEVGQGAEFWVKLPIMKS